MKLSEVFSKPQGGYSFWFRSIKGVGESAVHSILEERERNGEYKDIFDFVQRVNLSACNRKNIENLLWQVRLTVFPASSVKISL